MRQVRCGEVAALLSMFPQAGWTATSCRVFAGLLTQKTAGEYWEKMESPAMYG